MANTTKTRTPKIFVVTDRDGDARLVRALSAPAAIQHTIAGLYSAKVATQDQLVAAISDGVKVEDATAQPELVTDSTAS